MSNEQEVVIRIVGKNMDTKSFADVRQAISGIKDESKKGKPETQGFFESLRGGAKASDVAKTAVGSLTGVVGKFVAGFTIASIVERGASALFSFAAEAVAGAGKILDLRKETGLSTDAIQRFDLVASKSGSTLTDWTRASFKLGIALAGGGESLKASLDKLGLSYENIRQKSPEAQFVAVTDKLRTMTDVAERNRIGAQLFGRRWEEIAVGVVDGHLQMANATKFASQAQLEAINATEQAWKDLKHEIKSTLTTFIGEWALARQTIGKLTAEQQAHYQALVKGGGDAKGFLKGIGQEMAWVSQRTSAFGKDLRLGGEEARSYGAQLDGAAKQLAGMTAATKAEIIAAEKLGVEEDDLFRQFGINKGVLALLKDEQQKHTKAVEDATKKAKDRADALERIRHSEIKVTDAQRASILELRKREVAETDIALAIGVTAAQIKQVVEADEKATKAASAAAEERGKSAQRFNETLRELNAVQLQRAEEKAAREVALLFKVMDAERARVLVGTHGTQRRLIEIDQAERAELGAIATQYDAKSAQTSRLVALTRERYRHERDLATGTANTIEERMRAQGVATRADLQQTASDARRDYEQMRTSGVYTADQLREAWKRWYDADRKARGDWSGEWRTTLSGFRELFEGLAKIGGESFGGVAQWIGTVITASELASQATDKFKEGLGQIKDGDTVAGLATVAASIGGIVAALDAATSSGNRMQNVIGGALTGAQMGAQVAGPWGALAGGIIGGLVGAFRKDHVKDTMKAIGSEYGVKISEGLAKEINELAKKVSGPTDKARKEIAALLSLDKIIAEGGGVNSGNVATYGKQALALFEVIKRGGKDGAMAVGTLNTVFGQLEPIAAKAGHIADASLLQIVVRAREAGTEIDGVRAFLDKHLTGATTSLGTFAKANFDEMAGYLSKMNAVTIRESGQAIPSLLDDWKEFHQKFSELSEDSQVAFSNDLKMMKSVYQQDFTDLGIFTDTTFRALIANGRGFLEALDEVGPSLDAMIDSQKKLGFEGDESFNKLLRFRELTQANEPLLRQVGSLKDLMLGLGNAVGVDQAAFDAFGRQATSQMNKLTEAGFASDDALKAMAPTIQTLIELQDRFGFTVDDATQDLINQAREAGVAGEKHKSASERMVDGINKVVERLDALMHGFGMQLPDAIEKGTKRGLDHAQTLAGGVRDAIAGIPTNVQIGVGFGVASGRIRVKGNDGTDLDYEIESYASGGLAVGDQIARIGDSPSRKEIVGDIPFMTKALTGAIERLGAASSGRQSGAGGGDVYIAVDSQSGQARRISLAEFRQIEQGINAGLIRIDRGAIQSRAS